MANPLDLTGEIAEAINGAALRGHTLVLGYVDDDGFASMSFRGSAQVHSPQQLAVWARKTNEGLATEIAASPKVSLLFFEPNGPGPRYLSIRGTARVDPSANDAVYAGMVELEQQQDPDKGGVAVIIDVDTVNGFGAGGPFQMAR
jgi:hypothetical protein